MDISDCSCSGHKQVVSSDRHFGQGTEHHNWLGIRLAPCYIQIHKKMLNKYSKCKIPVHVVAKETS